MKNRILVPLLSITCMSVMLFSCSSSRYSSYQKKTPGYSLNKQLNDKNNPQNIFNGSGEMPAEKVTEAVVVNEVSVEPTVLSIPAELVSAPLAETQAAQPEVKTMQNLVSAQDNTTAPAVKNQWLMKKMTKAIVKNATKADNASNGTAVKRDVPLIVEVIVAFLLPPLAVFLHKEEITGGFFLNILLWFLLYFPGLIHALLIVFDVV